MNEEMCMCTLLEEEENEIIIEELGIIRQTIS